MFVLLMLYPFISTFIHPIVVLGSIIGTSEWIEFSFSLSVEPLPKAATGAGEQGGDLGGAYANLAQVRFC